MTGKPKGDVPLTNRERNRTYRVRKQREERELHRKLADYAVALHRIAHVSSAKEAREIAEWALVDAG
jgi:hypothetical protein